MSFNVSAVTTVCFQFLFLRWERAPLTFDRGLQNDLTLISSVHNNDLNQLLVVF